MTSVHWYVIGALLTAMLVVMSRDRGPQVNPATEIFMVLTWPLMVAILILGTAVAVVRIIWKGDYPDE